MPIKIHYCKKYNLTPVYLALFIAAICGVFFIISKV